MFRTYESGIANPGEASFGIQFDTADAAHVKLAVAKAAGTTLKFALGWSDGTAPPTAAASVFTLPTTRSWLAFDGEIDFAFDFALNAVVTSAATVTTTSPAILTVKV